MTGGSTMRPNICVVCGVFMILAAGCGEREKPRAPQVPGTRKEPGGQGDSAPVAALLEKAQGKWFFNKDLYIARLKKAATTEEEKRRLSKRLALAETFEKRLGRPIHADIEIRGKRIIGFGKVEPQYDLRGLTARDGRLVGTALYHEDRHDPGDAFDVNVVLRPEREKLHFSVGRSDRMAKYVFTRSK
jgi:hypothetical protein